jgi:hypothetical protein
MSSSMKISTFPQSSGSITTSKFQAGENGINEGSRTGSSKVLECGEHSFFGFQAGQCSRSFAKSALNSEYMQNSRGQGEPPKVSRKLGKAYSPHIMAHFSAISPCKLTRRYAALESDFAPKIGTFGCRNRMSTM